MPQENITVVLVATEAGIRSTLAARFALVGVDLLSAQDIADPALARIVNGRAVLLLDEATIAAHPPDWLVSVLADPRWCHVVVLTDAAPEGSGADQRPLRIERRHAPAAMLELMPRWSADCGGWLL